MSAGVVYPRSMPRASVLAAVALLSLSACRPPGESAAKGGVAEDLSKFEKVPVAEEGQSPIRKPWEPEKRLKYQAIVDLVGKEVRLYCVRRYFEKDKAAIARAEEYLFEKWNTTELVIQLTREQRGRGGTEEESATAFRAVMESGACRDGVPEADVIAAARGDVAPAAGTTGGDGAPAGGAQTGAAAEGAPSGGGATPNDG
jgi:hypothetical protein